MNLRWNWAKQSEAPDFSSETPPNVKVFPSNLAPNDPYLNFQIWKMLAHHFECILVVKDTEWVSGNCSFRQEGWFSPFWLAQTLKFRSPSSPKCCCFEVIPYFLYFSVLLSFSLFSSFSQFRCSEGSSSCWVFQWGFPLDSWAIFRTCPSSSSALRDKTPAYPPWPSAEPSSRAPADPPARCVCPAVLCRSNPPGWSMRPLPTTVSKLKRGPFSLTGIGVGRNRGTQVGVVNCCFSTSFLLLSGWKLTYYKFISGMGENGGGGKSI